jgi:phosphohistidine phosphatase
VLARARKAGVNPALILSSPYRRAMESAEIAAKALEYKSEIVRTERLTPHASPADVWAEIRAHRDEPSILIAGHEPLLSATIAWMLGSTRALVEMKKGALMRIDFATIGADPRGVLQWMLIAKLS